MRFILKSSFYERDTVQVAEDLIGKILTRRSGSKIKSGRIIEVEAYLGEEDQACHTFGGRRTPRNEAMYGAPGSVYVYFIYGMHFCFNVVTGKGEAILVRALEPLRGFTSQEKKQKILSGPGKLCKQLGIDKNANGLPLFEKSAPIFISSEDRPPSFELASGPRIGISQLCGDAAHWPLRFGIKDHPDLSKPFKS